MRSDGSLLVTLESPAATRDGQVFEFTDVLTNPGQRVDCDVALRAVSFSERDAWGDPEQFQQAAEVQRTSCTDGSVSGSITLDEGEQARIYVAVLVDDPTGGPWTDSVTFTSEGEIWDDQTTVTRRSFGGGGDGEASPTTDEPTTDEPTTDEPTSDEPTTDEPTSDEPTTDEPTSDEPTTDEPTSDEPTTDEATTEGAPVPVPSSTSGVSAPGGPGAEAPTPSVVQTDGAGSGSRSLLPFAAAGLLLAAAGALALRPQAARRH